MPDMSNSNGVFSDNNLNLARVYGLEDSTDIKPQNLENLTGYNLNQLEPTNNIQNSMSGNQSMGRNDVTPYDNNKAMNNNTMRQSANNESMNSNDVDIEDNANINNNMMGQSTNNENMGENNTGSIINENANNNMMQQSQSMAVPQRQEQSFPTTRRPQSNMQISNQENLLQFQSMGNMNSFLRTQVGKNVIVQFLVGTNTLVEKSGVLLGVGSNYIVLKENGSEDVLVCDFDNIKFVRFEENSR